MIVRRVRRSGVVLRCEVVEFCRTPQFMSDIIRKLGINHKLLMGLVDEGLIMKFDECRSAWNGPLAHRYVAVKRP